MEMGHISQDRLAEIVENNTIKIDEWGHIRECETCNHWLRAYAARASANGKRVEFNIPPSVAS
jgi:hypothetical protein